VFSEQAVRAAAVVHAFIGVVGAWTRHVLSNDPYARAAAPSAAPAAGLPAVDTADAARSKVRDVAKALGPEEMWKIHNSCQ
jgi:hypothetical protein